MSKKKKRGTAARKRAVSTPPKTETSESIIAFGKAIAAMAKARQGEPKTVDTVGPLINTEALTHVPEVVKPTKSLKLRKPDAQQVQWTFMDTPLDEQPQSVPAWVRWVWYPFDNYLWQVVGAFSWGSGKYEVIVSAPSDFEQRKGTPAQAKLLAEAILSASDWETSWRVVMPIDVKHPDWNDYGKGIM
jgi:hypothetical protein